MHIFIFRIYQATEFGIFTWCDNSGIIMPLEMVTILMQHCHYIATLTIYNVTLFGKKKICRITIFVLTRYAYEDWLNPFADKQNILHLCIGITTDLSKISSKATSRHGSITSKVFVSHAGWGRTFRASRTRQKGKNTFPE